MPNKSQLHAQLQKLPQIGYLLEKTELKELVDLYDLRFVKRFCEEVISRKRADLEERGTPIPDEKQIIREVWERVERFLEPRLKRVINATGILLHTGLGRAPLLHEIYRRAFDRVKATCSLELNLDTGKRGDRQDVLENLLVQVTGAQCAAVVNNNAAAVLLALNTLAYRKETLVSRGQLIEIGGSFRLPEVMRKSGTKLLEVGTTNKTYARDYEEAVTPRSRAVLVAHSSNYRVKGFVHEPTLREVAQVCRKHNLHLIHDLGGGVILDLKKWGLPSEPVVGDSLEAGADAVTFSGDKILGGPQAGIIVGKRDVLVRMRRNHLLRALRPDKFTLALLEETLKLYLAPRRLLDHHPVLERLVETQEDASARAQMLYSALSEKQLPPGVKVNIVATRAQLGSGALPLETFPSAAVRLRVSGIAASRLAADLRRADPPIVGYTKKEWVYLDLKAVTEEDLGQMPATLVKVLLELN